MNFQTNINVTIFPNDLLTFCSNEKLVKVAHDRILNLQILHQKVDRFGVQIFC